MLQTERRADKDRISHRLLNETLPRIHAGKLTAKQTTIGPSHLNTEVHVHTSLCSPGSLGPWGFYLHLSVSSVTLNWDASLAAFTRSLCMRIESQRAVNHRTAFDTVVGFLHIFYFTTFDFIIFLISQWPLRQLTVLNSNSSVTKIQLRVHIFLKSLVRKPKATKLAE